MSRWHTDFGQKTVLDDAVEIGHGNTSRHTHSIAVIVRKAERIFLGHPFAPDTVLGLGYLDQVHDINVNPSIVHKFHFSAVFPAKIVNISLSVPAAIDQDELPDPPLIFILRTRCEHTLQRIGHSIASSGASAIVLHEINEFGRISLQRSIFKADHDASFVVSKFNDRHPGVPGAVVLYRGDDLSHSVQQLIASALAQSARIIINHGVIEGLSQMHVPGTAVAQWGWT